MKFVVLTNKKEDTIRLGKKLAKFLKAGDVITLAGDLGAGKTTFVSGVASGLGIKETIISPTFNILKCYFNRKFNLYHIDAYRLEDTNKELGLEEYIEGDGVALIEWPIYIKDLLKVPHLEIVIKNLGKNKRKLTFIAPNNKYAEKIKKIL